MDSKLILAILFVAFTFLIHCDHVDENEMPEEDPMEEPMDDPIEDPVIEPIDVVVLIGRSNNAGFTPSQNHESYGNSGEDLPESFFAVDHGYMYDVIFDQGWRLVDGNDPLICYPSGSSLDINPDSIGAGGNFHGQEISLADTYFENTGKELYMIKLFKQSSSICSGGWEPTISDRVSLLNGTEETSPVGQLSIYEALEQSLPQIEKPIRSLTYRIWHEWTSGCDSTDFYQAIDKVYDEVMGWEFSENQKFVVTIISDNAVNAQCCASSQNLRASSKAASLAWLESERANSYGIIMPEDYTHLKADELHVTGLGYMWHDTKLVPIIID